MLFTENNNYIMIDDDILTLASLSYFKVIFCVYKQYSNMDKHFILT